MPCSTLRATSICGPRTRAVEEEGRARANQPSCLSRVAWSTRSLREPGASRRSPAKSSEYRLADPGLAVTLPTNAGRPLPSTRAWDRSDDGDITWTSWRVPTVRLEAADALRLLLALPERPDARLGSSIRFFARVALLGTELVARGRFLPQPVAAHGRGRVPVRWSIAPGAGDEARIDALAAAMPGACLAADSEISDIKGARVAVVEVLDRLIDAEVAEEAAALGLDQWPQGRSMTAALDRWRETVRPRTGPYRTLFRLREPGRAVDDVPGPAADDVVPATGSQAPWTLEVLVAARDDPSLVLPAALVWTDPGPLLAASGGDPSAPDPEEALLADLGRATRLHPPLAEPARHSRTGRDRTRHRSGAPRSSGRARRSSSMPASVSCSLPGGGIGGGVSACDCGSAGSVYPRRAAASSRASESTRSSTMTGGSRWAIRELSDEELVGARERQERSRPRSRRMGRDRARRDRRDTEGDRGQRTTAARARR